MAWLATKQEPNARPIPAGGKATGVGEPETRGPKARSIPAWGEAPGMDATETRGLKARPIHRSIPHIPFVVFDTIFLQKCTKLILKRLFAVMRLLRIDVPDQSVQIRRSNGERTISSLPCELRQARRLCLEPFRGRRFEIFDQLRHTQGTSQTNGKMNMVRDSVHAETFAFGIAGNRGEIRMKVSADVSVDERPAIFRAENQMNQNKSERLGHRQDYKSGLQPSRTTDDRTWAFTPGWYKAAPMALVFALTLAFAIAPAFSQSAQQAGHYMSLVELRQDAAQMANKTVTVRCHFSQAKDGSFYIFSDRPRTVFPAYLSTQIRNSPQYTTLIKATGTDWLVLTGHLDDAKNFMIEDAQLEQDRQVKILVLNAKTNQPIHDEKLNVALKKDQIGSIAMPTDKNGVIEVDTTDATIIRILSNMYADCRPRGELYTNYSIADIRSHGITTGNLCSAAHPKANPGELILFEIPKTYVPQHPNGPLTHLPHSDEYPN